MKNTFSSGFFGLAISVIVAFGLQACGGGNDPAPVVTAPAAPNVLTVAMQYPLGSFGARSESVSIAIQALPKTGVEVKNFRCAMRLSSAVSVYPPDDYALLEISSVDLAAAEKLGFTIVEKESLKVKFSRPFSCSNNEYLNPSISSESEGIEAPITVAKELPPLSNESVGSSQREVVALREARVTIGDYSCAGWSPTSGGIFPGGDAPVYLLAVIPFADLPAAKKLGFSLSDEKTVRGTFPRPFECVGRFY